MVPLDGAVNVWCISGIDNKKRLILVDICCYGIGLGCRDKLCRGFSTRIDNKWLKYGGVGSINNIDEAAENLRSGVI